MDSVSYGRDTGTDVLHDESMEFEITASISTDDDTVGLMSDDPLLKAIHTANTERRKPAHLRNLLAFWFLGLCNNYPYVVMLSAANDILTDTVPQVIITNSTAASNGTTTTFSYNEDVNTVDKLICNPMSAGVILLADVLPGLLMKYISPTFIYRISYRSRVILFVVGSTASFIVVAMSAKVGLWLAVFGVVLGSIGAGLGEITYLSLTSFYDKGVVGSWSSGTGMAGVAGALIYAGLRDVGLSEETALLVNIVFPALHAVSYFVLLTKPRVNLNESHSGCIDKDTEILEVKKIVSIDLSLNDKLRVTRSMLKLFIPLIIVYYAEYSINQGLAELMYFSGIFLTIPAQYRWYQVIYQIGVFVSRSSVGIFHVRGTWIFAVLQVINLVLLLFNAMYRFIPSIWIVFAVIFYEGLLGGFAYVNTFYRISNEVDQSLKEFAMGITSLSDSTGIAISGFTSIPLHNWLCKTF